MQKTYWNKLTQFKYSLCYFDAHLSRCVKINRTIKICCAVASSAAIAAWATWQNLSFWWGLIIVASQVMTAVNEFLPYKKRIKELSDIKAALETTSNIYLHYSRSRKVLMAHDLVGLLLPKIETGQHQTSSDEDKKGLNSQ